jgi:hypothetical protein
MTDDPVNTTTAETQLVELHRLAEHNTRLALQSTQNRNRAICDAYAAGVPAQRISVLLGLTASRVHAIIKAARGKDDA